MIKINTLVFTQPRSGTGFMKSLINKNSNLNMHNINTSYLEQEMTLSDWFSLKNTNNFMIFPDILTILSKNLILGAEKYIYYIRKDLVAQSVSRIIAGVIGYRKHLEIPEPERTKALEKLSGDSLTPFQIHGVYTRIIFGHLFYQQLIDSCSLDPYVLYYENLCSFPMQRTSDLLRYLDVHIPISEIKLPTSEAQTSPYNEKLINRYKNSKYYQKNRIHDILDPKYQLTY